MKRVVFIALSVLIALSPVFAGGAKENAAAPASATVDPKYAPYQGVTLTFIRHSGYEADWMAEMAKAFYEESGIKVNIEQVAYSEMKNKIVIDISSENGSYDIIATTEYWLPEFNEGGWLADINTYLNDPALYDPAFEIEDVSASLLEANSIDGKLLAMPWKFNSQFLYYRTDLIKTAPKNWSEMLELARANTEDGRYGLSLALGKTCVMDVYLNCLYQNGGAFLSADGKTCLLDSKEALGALEYLIQLSQYSSAGSINNHWDEAAANFAQGNAAMMPAVNSQLNNVINPEKSAISDSVGFAEWPGNVHAAAVSSTWGVAITRNCKHPEAAYLFIQYMLNAKRTESLVEGTMGAAVPVRESLLTSASLNEKYPHFKTMNAISNQPGHTYVYPKTHQTTAIMDVLASYVQEAVIGTLEPSEALAKAKAEIDKML
jgi:multiple sugar transport system substrate-binding protein